MKEDKIAMKRALNEYKGKQDYERLLKKYAQLDRMYWNAIETSKVLDNRLITSEEQNKSLKVAVIVLFNLLLAALVACGWLWFRG